MKYTLIDKKPRAVLHEGRTEGIGHAFCKRVGDTLETIQPISPCKEYLNDVCFSEYSGQPHNIWGLSTVKTGAFEGTDVAYLVLKICGNGARSNTHYHGMDKDVEALKSNMGNIQKAVNLLEEKIGINGRTAMEQLTDDVVLSVIPIQWTKAYYLVSLFGLVQRASLHWDGKTDLWEYLKKVEDDDRYNLKAALPKVEKLAALKGALPEQPYQIGGNVHSQGIVAYSL